MKSFRGIILAVIVLPLITLNLNAQVPFVKQVLTANSGKFEFTPPYTDYVTLQSYNPKNQQLNLFGSIYTQSAQSILAVGESGFFAAQDSIVKYNLNTLKRIAAVPDSGLNRMALYKGMLLISRQYPVSQHFFEVRDTADLSLVAEVTGISGDCGGVCVVNDTVYVAVNGGWMGTQGKLAVIDPLTWTLKAEVPFGPDAIGIWDLYAWNGKVYSVNKTPYGMPDAGSVTVYNPLNRSYNNVLLPFKTGGGAGISGDKLFLGLNYGIGSFNMTTLSVADTVVVPDPGSSSFMYILSSVVDSINGRIYTNTGDYMTAGTCLVSSLAGDSITSYATGISSDVIAVDYRVSGLSVPGNIANTISVDVFPNPASERINLVFGNTVKPEQICITDITGRIIRNFKMQETEQENYSFSVTSLKPGTYYISILTADGRVVKPFIVAAR